jgi:aspartyl-tRNA(Asn)/glutamyl-tRNA(Gln) amidotransferase subunit A
MSKSGSVSTFASWRALVARDAAEAAHRLLRRIAALPSVRRRAIFATIPDHDVLAADLARGLATGGPLAGVPFVVKDLFPVAGYAIGAGSTFLADLRGPETADSPIVARVRECGGAVAGTVHLHEFAFGLTGENPHFGDCPNPRVPNRLSGGSSSGSAAAVGAGLVPFALGTDTAGSIRVPAAFCGLWGYRGTPGNRWIQGCFPLAPSFDTAGWFTTTAEDMLTALEAIEGVPAPVSRSRGFAWIPARELAPYMNPSIADALDAAAARIAEPLAEAPRRELIRVIASAARVYVTLGGTEAAAVHRDWLDEHRDDCDPAVWLRLDRARRRTAGEVAAAVQQGETIRAAMTAILETHDGLVLPAAPFAALRKKECTEENRERILQLTAPVSLTAAPAATIPVPLPDGTSCALQVVLPAPHTEALARLLHGSATAAPSAA